MPDIITDQAGNITHITFDANLMVEANRIEDLMRMLSDIIKVDGIASIRLVDTPPIAIQKFVKEALAKEESGPEDTPQARREVIDAL